MNEKPMRGKGNDQQSEMAICGRRKIFASHMSHEELTSKIYKQLLLFNTKERQTQLKHRLMTRTDIYPKKTYRQLRCT